MKLTKRNLLEVLNFLDGCKDYGCKDYDFIVDSDDDEPFIHIEVVGNYSVFFDCLDFELFLSSFVKELEKTFKVNVVYVAPQERFFKDCTLCVSFFEKGDC